MLTVLKRTEGFRAARRTNPVQVLGSTRIGKGASLTMVRIGDAEYVLGITDHSVTLITPAPSGEQTVDSPAEERLPLDGPATVVASAVAVPRPPDFAAALGVRLAARLTGAASAGRPDEPPVPPSVPEFLRAAYRVARRRPAASTDLSADAVTAALAFVRGDGADLPTPRVSTENVSQPAVVPDGSATPISPDAPRRAGHRTDALRHQEHSWTRSRRPSARSSELDVAVG